MRSDGVGRSRHGAASGGSIALGVLVAALGGLLGWTASASAQPTWSPAMSLVRCPSVASPRVVFPAADPFHRSGPGAILWSGDPADCAPSDAAAGSGIGIAEFATDDTLGPARQLPSSGAPRLTSLAAVTATGDGRIVVGGDLGRASSAAGGVSEGSASGPFTPAAGLGGPSTPLAVTTSYRGDVGLASVSADGRIELRLEQHAAPEISPPVVITSRDSEVTALAVNLDYRGDAIVAWAEDGGIFARERESTGLLEPTRRVASSPPAPRLETLISDDGRGIVAWETDQTSPVGSGGGAATRTTTSAFMDVSEPGVLFPAPHLLERFVDPAGLVAPKSGLQLVRLAYEGVVVAWTGLSDGHFVVRAAPVSISSIRPVTTVSDPDTDAMLADVATGPRNEIVALWTSAPRSAGRPDPSQEEILTARGTIAPAGVADFETPQVVAGPGLITTPRIGIDPVTDAAVAVWRNTSRNPGIDYSIRGPSTSDRTLPVGRATPRASPPAASGDQSQATVAVVAVVALLGFGVILVGLRARARSRRGGRASGSSELRAPPRGRAGADS